MNRTRENEFVTSGHNACAGCATMIMLRHALMALGEKTIAVVPACCFTLLSGVHPYRAVKVPLIHCAFETAAVTASGVKSALNLKGDRETTVITWAGDGGTFDIGLQSLSGAVERNIDFIYFCYDNEAYMNTGIQRSSATPWGCWTTTTPKGAFKKEPKKNMMEILAAHRIPYAATATVAFLDDFIAKVKKAKATKGSRFIHLLSPCVAGWRIESHKTVEISRLAVETNVFPLFEIESGEKWRITHKPLQTRPVRNYLKQQGRFSHLTENDIRFIQENVDREWQKLLQKEKL